MQTAMNDRNSGVPAAPVHNGHRRPLRVAAYCRVGNGAEVQDSACELQTIHYTAMIGSNPDWEPAGIFFDRNVSGRSGERTEFNRMMRMCGDGGIDLIIAKSISRFTRNALDCLGYIRALRELGVGVIFEKEGINTLEMDDLLLTAIGAPEQGGNTITQGKEAQTNADSDN